MAPQLITSTRNPSQSIPLIIMGATPDTPNFRESLDAVHSDYEEESRISEKASEDSWLLEIGTMLLSTALLTNLTVGLYELNGRPVAVWPLPITPNALASGLMAFMDACLLLVMSSCMGQLKWINYRRAPRSLAEMQLFDDASRRSFPGTFLLLTGKAGLIGIFGVVIALLTYMVSPFVQQVLQYPSRQISTETALLNRAVSYTEWTSSGATNTSAALPMKGAVYDALYSFAANDSLKTPYFSCPSGNCTWSSFPTLGVCSDCLNVTDQIQAGECSNDKQHCPKWIADANGNPLAFLDVQQVPYQMNVTCINTTLPIQNTPPTDPILEFIMMNASGHSPTAFQENSSIVSALKCKLYYCVQNAITAVSSGVFEQSFSPLSPQILTELPNRGDLGEPLWALSVPDSQPFIISGNASGALTSFLQIFTGQLGFNFQDFHGAPVFSSDVIEAMWGSGNVPGLMESVAMSISNRFRAAPAYNTTLDSFEPVLGTNFVTEPHFAVSWQWMILPDVVLFSTWIFLLTIMHKTKVCGVGIWKTSSFPLLFHGLCDQAKLEASNCETVIVMEKKAQGIAVQLVDHEGDGPSLLSHDAEHSESLAARNRFSAISSLLSNRRSYSTLSTTTTTQPRRVPGMKDV